MREEGLATSWDKAFPLPHTSPWYQAHAGLDAVTVNAWNHLQRDGILAGLHIIHLKRTGEWSGKGVSLHP